MGMGWDRIENVLWRVYHGALEGIKPKQIVVMIGTNNLEFNSNEEIADGIRFLLNALTARQSTAKILLVGVLPRRGMEERLISLNQLYKNVASDLKVQYLDAGNIFLEQDNKINESLFLDGLHPNNKGYERLGQLIDATIETAN
jgi:lysophospholipase L1-like esterase